MKSDNCLLGLVDDLVSASAVCLTRESVLSALVEGRWLDISVILNPFYVDRLGLFLEYLANIQAGIGCFMSVGLAGVDRVSAGLQKLLRLRRLKV